MYIQLHCDFEVLMYVLLSAFVVTMWLLCTFVIQSSIGYYGECYSIFFEIKHNSAIKPGKDDDICKPSCRKIPDFTSSEHASKIHFLEKHAIRQPLHKLLEQK